MEITYSEPQTPLFPPYVNHMNNKDHWKIGESEHNTDYDVTVGITKSVIIFSLITIVIHQNLCVLVCKAGLTIWLEWARAHGPCPIGGPTRFRSFDLFIFQLRFVYWSGVDNNPAMLKEWHRLNS